MEQYPVRFSVESDSADNTQPSLHNYTPEASTKRELKARLDKWLWAARFFKTRTLARSAIESGLVLYEGQIVTPGIEINKGATIEISSPKDRNTILIKTIIIKGLSTRRHNNVESLNLFEEIATKIEQSKAKRQVRYLRRDYGAYASSK